MQSFSKTAPNPKFCDTNLSIIFHGCSHWCSILKYQIISQLGSLQYTFATTYRVDLRELQAWSSLSYTLIINEKSRCKISNNFVSTFQGGHIGPNQHEIISFVVANVDSENLMSSRNNRTDGPFKGCSNLWSSSVYRLNRDVNLIFTEYRRIQERKDERQPSEPQNF